MPIVFAVSIIHIFMIRFTGTAGIITILITAMVMAHRGHYHLAMVGGIQVMDGVTLVTDGDILVMAGDTLVTDGDIIRHTTVVVGGAEATILLIIPVIHRILFIPDVIIPMVKEDLPILILTEEVEADPDPEQWQLEIQELIVAQEILGRKQQLLIGEQQEHQEVTQNRPLPVLECFRKREGQQLQVQTGLPFQQEQLSQAVRKVIHDLPQIRKAGLIPDRVVREAAVIPAHALLVAVGIVLPQNIHNQNRLQVITEHIGLVQHTTEVRVVEAHQEVTELLPQQNQVVHIEVVHL